jgi:hypothetical protein
VQNVIKLKYTDIDFDKYDLCVSNSKYTRIEAKSWYLDIVTNKNWEVIVLNDYQAVLPLPKARVKRKLFKNMVIQPYFCQQLGVFYSEINKNELMSILKLFKKESVLKYHFNSNNHFVSDILKQQITYRTNFILPLDKEFIDIKKGFKKGLKENLRNAKKASLSIKKGVSFLNFKRLKKENTSTYIKESNFKKMNLLTNELIKQKKGDFFGVFLKDELIAIAFYIFSNNRIIYLLSATTFLGKKNGATAFLMNYIIQKKANQPKILDFEGSEIEGIANFFKTFGSINEPFYVFSNS